MAENEKTNGKKQVPLRLSASLYDDLAKWAEDDFRSLNGQIEYLLTECVKHRKKTSKSKKAEAAVDPLTERFIFTYPDGTKEEFENVKVFLDELLNSTADSNAPSADENSKDYKTEE